MKKFTNAKKMMMLAACLTGAMTLGTASASVATQSVTQEEINTMKTTPMAAEETLNLTQEWDKVFPQSEKVHHEKVTFHNRYGITLAADLYIPKNAKGKLPAVAVSGLFGAVKEQSSGLYAQTLAARGYLTIAFDPSFADGCAVVREGLLCVLQDRARLSSAFRQLHGWMEHDDGTFLYEYADSSVQRRDSHRRSRDARRCGARGIFQQGCVPKAKGRQQGASSYSGRGAHGSLRQSCGHPV